MSKTRRIQVLSLAYVVCIAGCGGGDSPPEKSTPSSATATGTPGSASATATGGANAGTLSFTATPNPVHVEEGKKGSTTIAWHTGDGAPAQVYLCPPGKKEELFSGPAAIGSQKADWIVKNGRYEFALYAGTEHKTRLATVIVKSD